MIKEFAMTHLIFTDDPAVTFTQDDPPEWLVHPENKWWWTEWVLSLKVDESIESDFRKIRRTL